MSNLVERLRNHKAYNAFTDGPLVIEAADRITTLEAENARLKEALKTEGYKASGRGMAIAAGIVSDSFGEPSIAAEILGAAGLRTVDDMRKAEVDPYDVKRCRQALKELLHRRAPSALGGSHE